ncbi:hypothetical protein BKK52_05520 [Rodentibacter trehalosifermentans]|uniref:DUF2625 domain-containing protein n=1 Tax=Rodentibacter trehalosifermentans TaxID=1908263 RepID=A0A1V3J0W9_9PAST|nr:DUF2625 family protein [Rodentibacter trehalosifermentans]OOF48558.1 hypothetical protein BKK52_05520 [Rodentibacter trehalosifermentans]
MKSLNELIDKEKTTWNMIQSWFKQVNNNFEVLPKEVEAANSELLGMQLSTKTPLGAIIYETGGLLIDGGWLRILGSGHEKLPRVFFTWNLGKTFEGMGERPLYLLIADDIVGGYFAVNGGGLGEKIGIVYYYHPKKRKWESIGLNYSQFLGWALTADIASFYYDLRKENWQLLLEQVNGNQIINLETLQTQPIARHYQDLFTEEEDDKHCFGYPVN